MSDKLKDKLRVLDGYVMTPAEREAQRRSFAFGNAAIDNPNVTREMVNEIADATSCPKCGNFGIKPNRMNAPDGPICGCGRPSRIQSGGCDRGDCDPICDCPIGDSLR